MPLKEAADTLSSSPVSLKLRYLQVHTPLLVGCHIIIHFYLKGNVQHCNRKESDYRLPAPHGANGGAEKKARWKQGEEVRKILPCPAKNPRICDYVHLTVHIGVHSTTITWMVCSLSWHKINCRQKRPYFLTLYRVFRKKFR